MLLNDNPEIAASEISQRISSLLSFSDVDLKEEMRELKQAIMENPAACSFLKEEDIGILVSSLRKITHVDISVASAPKARATKPKTKQLTAEELAKALDDEDF